MDREKVIEAFDEAKELVWTDDDEYTVGYNNGLEAGKNIALTLLKEQEAKQTIKQIYHVMMNRDYENPVEVTRYDWLCPTCKSLLCRDIDVIDDNYHFCKVCGQAVKWE